MEALSLSLKSSLFFVWLPLDFEGVVRGMHLVRIGFVWVSLVVMARRGGLSQVRYDNMENSEGFGCMDITKGLLLHRDGDDELVHEWSSS